MGATLNLPAGLDKGRFISTTKNAIQTHPSQKKLLEADRKSLFLSIQKCCADGLVLDGREAALVIRGGKVSYEPMVQGLIRLARNSGEISKIDSEIVYANDEFSFKPGRDLQPDFEPEWKLPPSERGPAVLAYAVIHLKSGDPIVRIMHEERIMQIANQTPNKNNYSQKSAHFTEWWRKTVIKNALKYAPKSNEIDKFLNEDNYSSPEAAVREPIVREPVEVAAHNVNAAPTPQRSRASSIVDAEYSKVEAAQVVNQEVDDIPI